VESKIILRAVKNSSRGMRQLVEMDSHLLEILSKAKWNISEQ